MSFREWKGVSHAPHPGGVFFKTILDQYNQNVNKFIEI